MGLLVFEKIFKSFLWLFSVFFLNRFIERVSVSEDEVQLEK